MTEKVELIRASTRPVILFVMVLSSALMIGCDIIHPTVEVWCYTTLGMAAEWVLERPFLKAVGKA